MYKAIIHVNGGQEQFAYKHSSKFIEIGNNLTIKHRQNTAMLKEHSLQKL